jgi:hypothetical protein
MTDLPVSLNSELDRLNLDLKEAARDLVCCPNCTLKSPYAISGPITTTNIIASGEFTSVHKALEIPEIRHYVYKILELDSQKRTLVSMALVCRAFTESALDVIWYSLVGFAPLLSVLPITLVEGFMVGTEMFYTPTYFLSIGSPPKFIIFEDGNRYAWERFDTYANRVYELTQLEDILNIQILRMLVEAKRAKEHCIFPNLQTLSTLYIYPFIPPVLLKRLITPSLRSLGVRSAGNPNLPLSDHEAATIGEILNILTPSIQDSGRTKERGLLQHFDLDTYIPSACLDRLISLRRLRVLHFLGFTLESVGGIDYLQGLSTLPYLDDLTLAVEEDQFFRPVPPDGFPSLRNLSLIGKSPNIKSVFYAIPSNRLTGVEITDGQHDWSTTAPGAEEVRARLEEWHSCFRAIVQQAKSLLTLRVALGSDTANPGDIRACALSLPMMSIIKPFLELRVLNTVKLEGFIKLPCSDADIRDLAVAWPKIKCMGLPSPLSDVMQPSLMSLRILSRFCPYLQTLRMGLDVNGGTDIEPNSELLQQLNALPVVTTNALTKLDVYESDLRKEDVTRLAGQLRDWFPLLKKVIAAQKEVAADITTALSREM